jgi:hypothetical protein
MSKPVFLNHEIVFNPTGNEFDKARDQLLGTYKLVKIEDWEYKFIKQPKLSIPKKIAEELEELTGKTNWESTPYSVIEEKGKINTWAYLGHGKCSEQLYKFCRDNTRLMHAYLNPLTRPFVEVEG